MYWYYFIEEILRKESWKIYYSYWYSHIYIRFMHYALKNHHLSSNNHVRPNVRVYTSLSTCKFTLYRELCSVKKYSNSDMKFWISFYFLLFFNNILILDIRGWIWALSINCSGFPSALQLSFFFIESTGLYLSSIIQ